MKRELQKEEIKQRIQKVAISLFQKQGYQKTTVSQITAEAGVAKGTFFNYFKTKESVLHCLGVYQTEQVSKKVSLLLDTNKPASAIIKELFLLLAKMNEHANPQLVRSWFHIAITDNTFHQSETLQIEKMKQQFILVFETGKQRGELISDVSAEEMASIAILNFFGILLHWCTNPNSRISLEEKTEQAISLLFRGIELK
ncbi:TetR/AcrR family transcriptional regulator [Priestia megaterium]|nr:TetR/AcrR family transcriptional regulator [Priestia megaterium]